MHHESFDALALDKPGGSLIIVKAVPCVGAPLRDATVFVVSAASTIASNAYETM